MLFVSAHPGYKVIGLKRDKQNYHPVSGEFMDVTPGIDAEFVHGGVPSWAQDIALANKSFRQLWSGLPDDSNHHWYISRYDTDKEAAERGWDAETKQMVEEKLLNHRDHGRRFLQVDPPSVTKEAPWPNYDDAQWKQVVPTALEIGADLEYCLEYERARDKPRPAVIEALVAEIGVPEELVAA